LSQTKTGDIFQVLGEWGYFNGEKVGVDFLTCGKNKNL
jgi:hypothetical protein